MAYADNQKISGLNAAAAVTGDDLLIVQKAGEDYAKKIKVSEFMAAGAGIDYRAGKMDLVVGSNPVLFSSGFPMGTSYVWLVVVRRVDGADMGFTIPDDSIDENGFICIVDYVGTIQFFVIKER